jgi:hypothetical protein
VASISDDEILDAVRIHMQGDTAYRRQLAEAVESKNNSWVRKLIHFAIGIIVEVGRAVLAAITGWFLPRPPAW